MKRFAILISYPSGVKAHMPHLGKNEFCKRTAKKHLAEWVFLHGISAEIVPV